MKIVIIGNGPAGTTAANKIRSLNKDAEIKIYSYENYPYYARPRLHELIEGKINENELMVFKNEWYEKNNIILNLNQEIIKIDKNKKEIYTKNNKDQYDKLLIATGANPFIPPIKGIKNENIFTLRTINDAVNIKNNARGKNEIIVIGGGLLGLELANSFIEKNRTIRIVEVAECLLNKQLANEKSCKLQNMLEEKGFVFYLCELCEEIYKDNNKLIVKTKSNKMIHGDIIIVSAGALPRIEIAREAGLDTDRGIIVNNFLQTNDPDIYAAGDCIQFKNKTWGFVKSSIDQGNIAGENIINNNIKEYVGTNIDVKLKVRDIDLNNL